MSKRLCLLCLAVCLFVLCLPARSQTAHPEPYDRSQKKYTFTIQPLQLFNAGLKLDFEMRLGNGPGWLQFSPAVYYATNDYDDSNHYYYGNSHYNDSHDLLSERYSKMRGAGLDVNFKHFENARRTFYTAAGLTYTRFNLSYRGWESCDYIEDGLAYRMYRYGFVTQHINRVGVNFYIGHQSPTRSAFVFDIFGGLSYRHSFSEKNKFAYNDHMFSHGRTGYVLLAGIRMGFGIK